MRHTGCVNIQPIEQGETLFPHFKAKILHNRLACPLTGDPRVEVLEEIPASLLVDCYQRDLGIDITSEFSGIEFLSLCHNVHSDLIFFSPAITGSSRFYQALRTFHWYYPPDKFEYDRAASWIQPGDSVLDIGCGSGHFSTYLPDAIYTGLEPQPVLSRSTDHPTLTIYGEDVADHALTHHAVAGLDPASRAVILKLIRWNI